MWVATGNCHVPLFLYPAKEIYIVRGTIPCSHLVQINNNIDPKTSILALSNDACHTLAHVSNDIRRV